MKNNLVKYAVITSIIILIYGCGSLEKAVTLNPSTNYFPAKKNKQTIVLKNVEVDKEALKSFLLVVPTSDYWLEMGTNLNHFDTVMTFEQFQTTIVQEGLTDKILSVSDMVGLNRAYKHYRPFLLLNLATEQKDTGGWYTGLTLYDPERAEVVFQNEIKLNLMWDGWTDQGTMFPLFNSLLDYLRNEKE